MIADTCLGLLSSSPINLPLLEDLEWNFPGIQTETLEYGNGMEDFERLSGTTNLASSEGEDNLISEFTIFQERLFEGLILDNEYLLPAVNCNGIMNTSGNNPSEKLDWSNRIDNDSSPCSPSTSNSSQSSHVSSISNNPFSSSPVISHSNTRKRKPASEFVFCTKWNTMNLKEQVKSVERLMTLINERMGLREQLEISRLINPPNINTNSGTFFTIDVGYIDDSKWSKILEHVYQRLRNVPIQEICPASKKSKKMSASLKIQQKALQQRQKKEYSQQMKEKRSGLFQQEEILALKQCDVVEEDIDVLD